MTAAATPREIVLDLPAPPAANRLRRIDWANKSRHRAWQKQCDARLLAMRHRYPRPAVDRFAIDILLDRRAKFDLDATLKATLDYLVRIELVPDDSQKYLDDVHIHWGS